MGRVSRYKKVKKCYNSSSFGQWGIEDVVPKKKRSRTAQRLKPDRKTNDRDAAPAVLEDEFDMQTFHVKSKGSVDNPLKQASQEAADAAAATKQQVDTGDASRDSATATTRKQSGTVEEETPEDAKLFRQISKQMEQDKLKDFKKSMERKQGESKRAFRRRMKTETRNIIQQAQQTPHHNVEKKEKKKEFLKRRKKRKREPTTSAATPQQRLSSYGDDDIDDEPRQPDPVVFGDCVERPPVFTQLPRGADTLEKRTSSKPQTSSIEALRDQVQKQYAALREKRRQQHV